MAFVALYILIYVKAELSELVLVVEYSAVNTEEKYLTKSSALAESEDNVVFESREVVIKSEVSDLKWDLLLTYCHMDLGLVFALRAMLRSYSLRVVLVIFLTLLRDLQ